MKLHVTDHRLFRPVHAAGRAGGAARWPQRACCAPAPRASTTRHATSSCRANFNGVLDPIYVRSVVLDNGRTRAALVAIDAGAMPTDLYRKVSARAAAELKIPASQLLMSASHTHSVPFQAGWQRRGNHPAQPARVREPAAAGAGGLGHGRFLHQRESRPRESEDQPLVGGPELRRHLRQDGGGGAHREHRPASPLPCTTTMRCTASSPATST